jgi:hypothetical protein
MNCCRLALQSILPLPAPSAIRNTAICLSVWIAMADHIILQFMKSLKNVVTVTVLPMTLPVHDAAKQYKTL